MYVFSIFVRNQLAVAVWAYNWVLVLFCRSTRLFLCLHYAIFITMADLYYDSKSERSPRDKDVHSTPIQYRTWLEE